MTTIENSPSVVDEVAYTVRRTLDIAAPVEKVWAAVTRPEHISRWFGVTVLDGDGIGARGTMTFGDNPPVPLRVEAMEEPHLVAYRWTVEEATGAASGLDEEARSTVFTFTLEALPTGTRLTVVERGFETTSDPRGHLESHRGGWESELDKLVVLLEGAS